jgi:hypothetical protein
MDQEELARAAFDARVQQRLTAFLQRLSGGQQQGQQLGEGAPAEECRNLTPGDIPGTEVLSSVTITRALRRLLKLLGRCIACNEAVLLTGDTGKGKTTAVQLFALLLEQLLVILN